MLAISVALHLIGQLATAPKEHAAAPSPEQNAVAFLRSEVPARSREKHCFSCHNNGDAARALLHAARSGLDVPDAALADTARWLIKPEGWEHNGGEGPFVDKRLARVAFTAALATAFSTGRITDPKPVVAAAGALALDQAADGSWPLEGEDATECASHVRPAPGHPAGAQSLATADPARFRSAIARADNWLLARKVQNVTDASIILMAFESPARQPAVAARLQTALDLLARIQAPEGGWGLDAYSPPEPFDTAWRSWPCQSASRPTR